MICVEGLVDKYDLLDKGIEIWISPVNEPQWKWGGPDASQEGCHYDPEVLAAYYNVFWDVLTAYNAEHGTNFRFDAFECGNYLFEPFDVDVADYLEEMSKYDYFDELGEILTHTYGANDSVSARKKFASFMEKNYPELEVTATEFCEMESGEYDTI